MNRSLLSSTFARVRVFTYTRALLLVLYIGAGLVSWAASTNTPPPKWLPLSELTKKWADTPLADIQHAAEGGDLTAQHYLGYCFAEGFRFPRDLPAGLAWYQRAANAGYIPSLNNLGVAYQYGKGLPRDLAKALSYYRLAADAGMGAAQNNLGKLYRDGDGVQRDPAEAMKWFRRAVEQGDANAMISLYFAYWDGNGVASDHAEAMKWLTKAAEAGNAYAECLLGYRYEQSEWEGTGPNRRLNPGNIPEALRWYRRSAEQNWPGGQYNLGLFYLEGKGVPQDEEHGLELMRAGADQNHAYSQCKLAGLYAQGIGEPRNEQDRPFNLLLAAAAGECPDAYWPLAFRCQHGLGTEIDLIAAAAWQCRATLSDLSRWGTVYTPANADPTEPFLAALSLYLKAAGQKDAGAFLQIGDMYRTGQNVPKNPAKAWLWYTLGSQHSAAGAGAKISQTESLLTAEEQSEAKRLLPGLVQELNYAAAAARELGEGLRDR